MNNACTRWRVVENPVTKVSSYYPHVFNGNKTDHGFELISLLKSCRKLEDYKMAPLLLPS